MTLAFRSSDFDEDELEVEEKPCFMPLIRDSIIGSVFDSEEEEDEIYKAETFPALCITFGLEEEEGGGLKYLYAETMGVGTVRILKLWKIYSSSSSCDFILRSELR